MGGSAGWTACQAPRACTVRLGDAAVPFLSGPILLSTNQSNQPINQSNQFLTFLLVRPPAAGHTRREARS